MLSGSWFFLAVVTALVWGIVPFFEKTAMAVVPNGLAAVAIRSAGAALGMLIPLVSLTARTSLAATPPKGIIFLLTAGFLGSVVGQLTYLTAMKSGEMSRVTPVASSWLIVALGIAVLFLGEPISVKKCCAAALIVGGVFLLK